MGLFRPRKKAAGGRNSPFPQNDRRVPPVGARKHPRIQQFVQGKRATAQYPSRNTGCFTVSNLQNTKRSSVPRGIRGVSLFRNFRTRKGIVFLERYCMSRFIATHRIPPDFMKLGVFPPTQGVPLGFGGRGREIDRISQNFKKFQESCSTHR